MTAREQVRRALLIGIGSVLVAACATPLQMPGPVRAMDTPEETREVIVEGMSARGWIIDAEEPGRILANLFLRGHVAKVWIDYDDTYIRFSYGGSQRLKCRPAGDSCSSIDGHYNKWARNLAIDINRAAAKRRADG